MSILRFLYVLCTGSEEDASVATMLVVLSAYLLVAIAACMTVRYTFMFFAALFEWIGQNHLLRLVGNAGTILYVVIKHYFPAVGADLQLLGSELTEALS